MDVFITEVSWMFFSLNLSLKCLGCFYHWSLLDVFITEGSWMFLSLKYLGCFYHWSILDAFITEVSWMFLLLKSLWCFYHWSLFDAFISRWSRMLLSHEVLRCFVSRVYEMLYLYYRILLLNVIESPIHPEEPSYDLHCRSSIERTARSRVMLTFIQTICKRGGPVASNSTALLNNFFIFCLWIRRIIGRCWVNLA